MDTNYDVIIVGARVAGASLAFELSKRGFKVLMVDRSTFPSDTLSTHNFFNNSFGLLRKMGVLDRLLETGTPTYNRAFIQFDHVVIDGHFPEVNGESECLCIRRIHLDQILFEHAQKQESVTAVAGFRVTNVIFEKEAVKGIVGIDPEGNTHHFRAKLVVGADGRNSLIRKLVKSKKIKAIPTDFATYVGYLKNFQQHGERCTEFYKIADKLLISFPTSDHLHVLGIMFPLENKEWMERFRNDLEKGFRSLVDCGFRHTSLPERLRRARFVGPIKGLLGYDNDWYQGMGNGWALIGDAISFKDPAVGQGMHDAIYGSQILADVLSDFSNWSEKWLEMADLFQNRMSAKMMSRFEMACQFTKNIPFSEQQHFVNQMISNDPVLTETFLGIYNYAYEPLDLENKVKEKLADVSKMD